MNGSGLTILGAGCVTALGRGGKTVHEKILAGEKPESRPMEGPEGFASLDVFKVPLPVIPPAAAARLRRSSAISYFACAAAADAVQESGPLPAGRTALVFASSNGAVVYTRRFFEEVAAGRSGSPLLFPETVYNAPASHVAAMLALDGPVLTLVGDASAGIDALATASDLIDSGAVDCCLVVAAEELDWVSCEGYRRWKLVGSHRDTRLSEGAVAIVLGRAGDAENRIEKIHPGRTCQRSSGAARAFHLVVEELVAGEDPAMAILSTSGARPGCMEEEVVRNLLPGARIFSPKKVIGEMFSASSLLQCLCAWNEIREGRERSVLVPVFGWSGQAGGVLLTSGNPAP